MNCAICHQENGPGGGQSDLRYGTAEADLGVVNLAPEYGDLGVAGALVVNPGSPETSVLSLRMHALDVHRMPPLATALVDTTSTTLVDAWITALSSDSSKR